MKQFERFIQNLVTFVCLVQFFVCEIGWKQIDKKNIFFTRTFAFFSDREKTETNSRRKNKHIQHVCNTKCSMDYLT